MIRFTAARSIAALAVVLLMACDDRGASNATSTHLTTHFASAAPRVLGGAGFDRTLEGFVARQPPGSLRGLNVVLPHLGNSGAQLRAADGFGIEVRELGLDGVGRPDGTSVVYSSPRCRSVWTSTMGGAEEWLDVEEATEAAVARWELSGGTLRQSGEGAQILDGEGKARFTVTAPAAFAADGSRARAWLTVEGETLALYTSGRGHVLVDPSWTSTATFPANWTGTLTVLLDGRVLASGDGSYVFDPATGAWAATGAPVNAFAGHSATLLLNGTVLIAGGSNSTDSEIFNPATNTYTATSGQLNTGRYSQTMTLLQNGKALMMGGEPVTNNPSASCELFDPATGKWTATGSMTTPRTRFAAITLQDGKALACGGLDVSPTRLSSCELYDPSTGTWAVTGSLVQGRAYTSLIQLPTGKVLTAGGDSPSTYLAEAELFDPVTKTWSPTGSMTSKRNFFTATLLPSGKVLATTGYNGVVLNTAELYDPVAGTWSATSPLAISRYQATAVTLPGGRVLVAGDSTGTNTAELYEPAVPAMSAYSQSSKTPRTQHTSTLLPNGKLLVVGGFDTTSTALSTVELLDPAVPAWTFTGSLTTPRANHRATLLANGKVLITGGVNASGTALASAELFDPATNTSSATGTMITARQQHTQTLLDDGRVLVAGGADTVFTSLNTVEIYDPSTGVWTAKKLLAKARAQHTATRLTNGAVVVIGGVSSGTTALASAELYDPAGNTWTASVPNPSARAGHVAMAIGDQVLVAGGFAGGSPLNSAQLYSRVGNTFQAALASTLSAARGNASVAMALNGKVVIAGGSDGTNPLKTVDFFDPLTQTFSAGPPMVFPRAGHTATLMPNGTILLVGTDGTVVNVDQLDEGRGVAPAMIPTLSSSAGTPAPGGTLSLGGALLTGVSDGSTGGPSSSRTNYPLLELERSGADGLRYLPATSWTASTLTAALPAGFPQGIYWARAVVDGVPSAAFRVPILGALTLSPLTVTLAPRQTQAFSASYPPPLLSSFTWAVSPAPSGGTITQMGAYTAGTTPNVTDTVKVTDAFGTTVTAQVTVGPALAIAPASITLPPSGTQVFTASGGLGPYTWAFVTNCSGAAAPTGGSYKAGIVGGCDDVIQATDQVGSTSTATVHVSAAISIAPATPSTPPRGTLTFSASGGSGTGFSWSLPTNGSGGSITTGGSYTAGSAGGTSDVVKVVDSLGNTKQVTVTVTGNLTLSATPAGLTVSPRGSKTIGSSGGSGSGVTYAFVTNASGATLNAGTGLYTAGATPLVQDTIGATDSLGNTASIVFSVQGGCVIAPAAPSVPPQGSKSFSATGGSGTGYSWSLQPNNSGGSIDPVSGAYLAGPTPSVTDTVKVIDSLGNVATTPVSVTGPLVLSPATVTRYPQQGQAFTASGGSGSGYTFSMQTSNSGGSVTSVGAYTAGTTGPSTDVVKVIDSLNNVATATVTVTAGVSVSPSGITVPPKGSQTFSASGGSASGFKYAMQVSNSGGSIDLNTGVYTAGTVGNVTDTVKATDSAGNVGTQTIAVSGALVVSPQTATSPPNGPIPFTVSGGSGTGYLFTLDTNASGGSITPTGSYKAGPAMGNDVVKVVDSLGNQASVIVNVTNLLGITPGSVNLPPRGTQTFGASGGSGTGFTWTLKTNASGASLDATGHYVAGATPSKLDTVKVTDSLGNVATATVSVGAGVSVSPATIARPPRGSVSFTASGGSNSYTWALSTNASGASITAAGLYTAGAVGGVADVVLATDSLGNAGSATVTVGPVVAIAPLSPTALPKGPLALSATGGSGTGYVWALVTNGSGATLDANSGAYRAGATGSTSDQVSVTDSLGNQASVTIAVSAGLSSLPAAPSVPPRATLTLVASGGSAAGYQWTLFDNASGGTLTTAGVYRAGPMGGVIDTLQLTDNLGNLLQVSATVTAGVSVSPATLTIAPRGTQTFTASGGSDAGFSWTLSANGSGGSINATTGAYTAGAKGGASVTDLVQASDSLGNTATATVSVTDSVIISPMNLSLPPAGKQQFTASGGSGTGYAFTVLNNNSGATIDAASGLYVAGANGPVTDIVRVTDSKGSTSDATVSVTTRLLVSPANLTLAPGAAQPFTCSGGGMSGLTFSVGTNRSGASIDAASGAYTAGRTGGVTDEVRCTDSLGSTASALVTVSAGLAIAPAAVVLAPNSEQLFSATGGSGTGVTWSITANASGGSIDATSGRYVSGPSGGGEDTITASDSLGNTATAIVTVRAGAGGNTVPASERAPVNGWGCSASPGSGGLLVLALGLVLRPRRRSRGAGALLGAVLLVGSMARAADDPPPKPAKTKKAVKKKAPPPAPPEPVAEPAKPPEPSPPPPPPAAPEKQTLAVLDVGVTGEKLDTAAFTDLLASASAQLETFKVLSSQEMATILGAERQRQLVGCSDDTSCMSEIGQALGAGLLLQASIGKVGDTYLITARLVDAPRARVLSRGSLQTKSADLLLKGLWQVAEQVFDGYAATLSGEAAERFATHPKLTPPTALTQSDQGPSRPAFGASLSGVFGYQPLTVPSHRTSVGAEVYATMRAGRLDVGLGAAIAPSPGARLSVMVALIDTRFRLDVGLRGAAYFGLGVYGGGLGAQGEFAITSWFSAQLWAAGEAYPVAGSVVISVLGGAGVGAHF